MNNLTKGKVMKNRFKAILILIIVLIASAVLAACNKNDSVFNDYKKQGYTVTVTFDGNGGAFIGKIGNKIVDMYRPSDYQPDEDGYVHIKLIEPTSRNLKSTGEKISLTMNGYSNLGWYKTRTMQTNDKGEPINENGDVLEWSNDRYYIKGTKKESLPLYEYAEPFDFDTDTIDVKVGAEEDFTLYACWVKYFEFDYYHVNEKGETTLVSTQTFDYKTVNAPDSKVWDKDTIWIPSYVDGAMKYSYKYSGGDNFFFPETENDTFDKAYLDENLTQEITTETFKHSGSFDKTTGTAKDRVQNIYFTTVPGKIYKIYKASDLVNNPNANGIYEIYDDLDFEGLTWPVAFSQAVFDGKMTSMTGGTVKFSNVNARFASTSSTTAGVFGALGETAVMENIAFENVTLTISSVAPTPRDMTIGTLFGNVDDSATVTNISLTNATLVIGYVAVNTEINNNQINLLANGKTDGITVTDTIHLKFTSQKVGSSYRYKVDPTKTTIDENNNVNLVVDAAFKSEENEIYEIQ